MRDRGAVLTGIGLGIGLMYFLDPVGGRRRRALVRDTLARSASAGADELGATARDLAYRASGVAARLRGTFRRPADDDVLLDRLRTQISGAVSHPDVVEVDASDHHVTVRGPILEHEVDELLDAIERVSGVREIINALDVHKHPNHVPAFRDSRTRPNIFQRQWSPATRLLVGAAGGVLAGYGASRRDSSGGMLAAAGAGLLARAVTSTEKARSVTDAKPTRRTIDVPFAATG